MVYHYCSVGTFLNIIKNHTLRMSDVLKSTDDMEAKSLLDAVKKRIFELYIKDGGFVNSPIYGMEKDDAFKYIIDIVMNSIRNDDDRLYYVTCFSENAELLSQWREYGDKGRGIAIGFEENWFVELCDSFKGMFRFSKVKYEHEDNEADKIIQERAEQIYVGILRDIDTFNTKELLQNQYMASYDIAIAKKILYGDSIFIKRKEFEIEQEWRLILDDEIEKVRDDWEYYYNWKGNTNISNEGIYKIFPNALEFMEKNGKIISYIDLKFDTLNYMPIKEIILGADCRVSENDIYHVMSFYGFDADKINVYRSDISYKCN